MSRRPPNADRAAQNQQMIKNLLKLTCNKTCADCKRNKHPRWASWNIGVFVCIRCSGIHRGMGTHISRVKSVDLDSWTDEQLQSIMKWGNARANKYWEDKLNPGHVPSEAKIENFIRTKYESRRWVMDGPMPDPSTLEVEGDEDVPLAVIQEKAKLERSASQQHQSSSRPRPAQAQQAAVNFFDDEPTNPPPRPRTTDIPGSRPTPHPTAAQKPSKPADSLLGLDFFGPSQPSGGATRPASIPSGDAPASGPSRPDLKQSILSLYASAPPKPQEPQHERNSSFSSFSSPPSQQASKPDAFGGLTDAFSGLSFPSTTSPPIPKQQQSTFSAFDSLTSSMSSPAAPKVASPSMSTSKSFFNDPPKSRQVASPPPASTFDLMGSTVGSVKAPAAPPSASNDMFDLFSSPVPKAAPTTTTTSPPIASPSHNSAFNLSSPPQQPAVKSHPTSSVSPSNAFSASTMDPWGGNAWSTAEPSPPVATSKATSSMKVPDTLTANDIGSGWGAPSPAATKSTPAVAADEDFGGWADPTPAPTKNGNNSSSKGKSGGFGGGDDLFANVWE
ncbi:ARF GAP with effector function(s) [Microsporum audouinii]